MNMPETYSYTRLFRSKFFAPCREILRQAKRPLKVGEIAQRLHQDYPDLQWQGRWSSIYVVLNRACMLPGTHILLVQTTPIRLYQYTGDDTTPDLLEPTIEAPAEELFDSAENKAYAELSAKIKDIISNMNEYAFEELVNRLIVQMGFGKKYKTTPKSGDSGVDGIIYGDELGLNTIYVQAKHYKPENIVGRPAIHQFIGSNDFKDRFKQSGENVNRIVQTDHFIVHKPIHRHHLQFYPSDPLQKHNARSHSPRILCTAPRCVDCHAPSF